ncbi:olfactory receptor 1C1-like [Pseudophryne corroboree]|uniref:olfactory receptor 1C1-like n=1 Tax=Pseudophryne corroboree TaxID=495146 RepID=UPI0030818070
MLLCEASAAADPEPAGRMKEYLINCTVQREFHLLAFSISADLQLLLFTGILVMYLLTVLGNLIIIGLIYLNPQLHTPMYHFLCNLSVQDTIYVSSVLPKFLSILVTGDTRIAFPACITQMFFFIFCIVAEFLLLTSMAYDRYVAICIPLRYTIIMNKSLCVTLFSVSWIVGFFVSVIYAVLISNSSFCNSQVISHFYCDLKAMIEQSSSDITGIKILLSMGCAFLGFTPFVLILISYSCIIATIMKIRSSAGRVKAFSSCSSHLTVVLLLCGTSLISYIAPESQVSREHDKFLSLMYIALAPMLNPLVYTLRNKQVLKSMDNILKKYLKC